MCGEKTLAQLWAKQCHFLFLFTQKQRKLAVLLSMFQVCIVQILSILSTHHSLDQLHSLVAYLVDDSRDIHHILITHLLQSLVYCDECPCPTYSSTAGGEHRLILTLLLVTFASICIYLECGTAVIILVTVQNLPHILPHSLYIKLCLYLQWTMIGPLPVWCSLTTLLWKVRMGVA